MSEPLRGMQYSVNPSEHRARLFVRYKMSSPEMVIDHRQLFDWLLEFENILQTSERTMQNIFVEHMATCPHPITVPKEFLK